MKKTIRTVWSRIDILSASVRFYGDNLLDPDQARQNAASDRSLKCLQDSDIIIINIHFSE